MEQLYEHSLLPQMFTAFCWLVLLISFLYVQLRELKPAAPSVKPPNKEYVLVVKWKKMEKEEINTQCWETQQF